MDINSYTWEEEKKDGDYDFEYRLSAASAVDRVRMIVDQFGADAVTVLTSFGVQSGVMLTLVAQACPWVRVLYIDTQGPTSERDLEFGRKVLDILGLKNLTVAKADVTREQFSIGMAETGATDSKIGQSTFHLLSQDVFKVTPLKQACESSNTTCLLSGVRRGQTADRDKFNFIQFSQDNPSKAHPILDWTDEQCLEFLRFNNIPPHPELDSLIEVMKVPEQSHPHKTTNNRQSSLLRSVRPERGPGMECGIHVQGGQRGSGKEPTPVVPNIIVGKIKCRFCIAAKKLLVEYGIQFVAVPVHLFPHLIPAGTKTVPVIYLNKKLIGGYGDLCAYLGVEDTLNVKPASCPAFKNDVAASKAGVNLGHVLGHAPTNATNTRAARMA